MEIIKNRQAACCSVKSKYWRHLISFIWFGMSLTLVFESAAIYTHAQSKQLNCAVSVADFNSDDGEQLGTFALDLTTSKYVSKSFQMPNTELFVNAAVFLDTDIGAPENAKPSEIYLILAVSKKRYSRIETEMKNADVVTSALSRYRIKTISTPEISTFYLVRPEIVIVTLKCR